MFASTLILIVAVFVGSVIYTVLFVGRREKGYPPGKLELKALLASAHDDFFSRLNLLTISDRTSNATSDWQSASITINGCPFQVRFMHAYC